MKEGTCEASEAADRLEAPQQPFEPFSDRQQGKGIGRTHLLHGSGECGQQQASQKSRTPQEEETLFYSELNQCDLCPGRVI